MKYILVYMTAEGHAVTVTYAHSETVAQRLEKLENWLKDGKITGYIITAM